MKKDEYSFLELFGNIDDEYIYQALMPWEKKADIEIEIAVHRQIEDIEGETFIFAFSASKE